MTKIVITVRKPKMPAFSKTKAALKSVVEKFPIKVVVEKAETEAEGDEPTIVAAGVRPYPE